MDRNKTQNKYRCESHPVSFKIAVNIEECELYFIKFKELNKVR